VKIGLISDSFSVKRGTGIARYSQKILEGLQKKGISVEPICLKPPKIPFGEAFNHLFRLPYNVLKRTSEFDLLHATAPITALCFPFIKKPKVITYHDIISMLNKDSGASLRVRLFAPHFFRIGKYCDRVIAVSTQTKEDLIKHLNIPAKKIVVINSGIDERFKPTNKKVDKDYYNIGYLGALTKRKNIDFLLRSLNILKRKYNKLNIKLLIYGEGKHLSNLKAVADSLNLANDIEFRGFVHDEELVKAYNSLDIFLLPSDWEGFGLLILEAQRCGLPVIIKKDANIPEEVSKHCLKIKSEQDMVDIIFKLINEPEFKIKIVQKGLNYSQNFTWEKTIDKTIEVYEEVISKKSV